MPKTNNFTIEFKLTLKNQSYTLTVIVPIQVDSTNSVAFQNDLLNQMPSLSDPIAFLNGYTVNKLLPCCWKLHFNGGISYSLDLTSHYIMNQYYHGCLIYDTERETLLFQTQFLNQADATTKLLAFAYDITPSTWKADNVQVFSYNTMLPAASYNTPSPHLLTVTPGSINVTDAGCSTYFDNILPTINPIICGSHDKAVIVFEDCCLDWSSVKQALINGYNLGIRYAWCGRPNCAGHGNNLNCGTRTYIQMSAVEYDTAINEHLDILCNC